MEILPSVNCPACGRPAMTRMRRLSMGPLVDHECKSCGRLLTVVAWRWAIVSLPLFVAVWALIVFYPDFTLLTVPGGFLVGVLLSRLVPLSAR